MVIINEVHERRLCTFAFGTGLSYKLSKNHPHLTELKDFIYSFQFEFNVVYFELIYTVCCLELSASLDFPRTWVFNKLTRKAPGALEPAVSPPPQGANTLRSLKICAQVV